MACILMVARAFWSLKVAQTASILFIGFVVPVICEAALVLSPAEV